jgi:peptide deformylase
MVCEIMRDEDFLKQVSEPAAQADIPVADDLLETLIAHKDGCVGMAANMIGISKRIIAIDQ